MDTDAVTRALRLAHDARNEGRSTLLEQEGFEILQALGLHTPARLMVRHSAEVAHTPLLVTGKVVVKVVADAISHKTDVGGVTVVRNGHQQIEEAVQQMEAAFADVVVSGFSIAEFVPYDHAFGHEWLLGMRWTPDFGPVVTVGIGGVAAEFVSAALEDTRRSVTIVPGASRDEIAQALAEFVATPLVTGGIRRQAGLVSRDTLAGTIGRFCGLADACRPDGITEFEVNPLVICQDGPVALDVLATVGRGEPVERPRRPVHKIHNLLQPRSVAIMGVSTRMNPGRVILRNLLREGFDPSAITVVKPATRDIDGCRAVPSIRDLPGTVDLAVLAVSADQVPDALTDIVAGRKAESVIVIPGGLEEKAGTSDLTTPMLDVLARSRASVWGGPVVNGGNCLGIQSRPGRYDTMFIPGHKLGAADAADAPLALITQSGAFAVSRTTRLANVRPRYSITVGNQLDLTVADYLEHLEHDPEVQVFGLYVEGFKPLDGRAALESVRRITASGRTVVLYRAGRTREGATASASHTAAIAGDYSITCALFAGAGAIVADSLDDFTDLVMLFTMLHRHTPAGRRIGAMSNAGYECVAIADSLGGLELARFSGAGCAHMDSILERRRLASLVDVHNPLDVTPMADDETFESLARAILDDGPVDVGVIGCVPATAALNTLAPAPSHEENLAAASAVASRLITLGRTHSKPMIAIVDAGRLYDAFAARLLEGGIPTFRSADRAMRLLGVWVENRVVDRVKAETERWVDAYGH
jgi:acyl-CoA synthetase (NDP forming)